MSDSRTKNSIRNIIFGLSTQVLAIIVNFVSRTIFIHFLGAEMLGISSLYTNILSLLSLAELGFGNAIIYSMYRPIKNNDKEKLTALLNYYKRIYISIIGIITTIGCVVIPFLPYIVHSSLDDQSLTAYYILFLINTVCSYVFVYKTSIINAQQKNYITKLVNLLTITIQLILQTIVLALTQNYIAFLIIQIICTLLNNIICSSIANKLYPYIKNRATLEHSEKKQIHKNVSSIFLYKVGGTILNNTDNIFISVLVNTISVGFYSNYYIIVSALSNIISIFFNAISASVGNLMTEKDRHKQESIFRQLNYIGFIITGFCALELFATFNDFISIWLGDSYIMDNNIMIVIVVNFFIYTSQNPLWIFRDTSGLFKDAKNDAILLAIANIILSYLLGKVWGILGILLATAISRLLITSWHQPYMLYKKIFRLNCKNFMLKQILYACVFIGCSIPAILINSIFQERTIFTIIIKIILVALISLPIFFITTVRTEEYKICKTKLLKIVKRKSHHG